MPALVNLIGKKFARLAVIRRGQNQGRFVSWWCECTCGRRILVRAGALHSENTRSCGCLKAEWVNPRKIINPEKTFWTRVLKGKSNECWPWQGKPNNGGYGAYMGKGAHVRAFEYAKGPLPKGKFALHTCDNRICCNPKHLFAGTMSDNSRDAWDKGRNFYQLHPEARPRGENHAGAKLTWVKVRKIRSLYKTGRYRQVDIAKKFDSTQAAVSQIIRNVSWREEVHHG